jgi:alpha-1,4-digalacturonate transport system permease protein
MAAFALSKYRFNGQIVFFVIILATLMVPASVLIVGIFKMVTMTGTIRLSLGGYYSRGCNTHWGLHVAAVYAHNSR